MLIAHLPAGYIAGSALARFANRQKSVDPRCFMAVLLLASVLPDFDLLWFHLADDCQHFHHTYWSHIPVFWLGVGVLTSVVATALRHRSALPYIGALTAGTLLHMILDTVAGGILWFYPLSPVEYRWVDVPSIYGWWVANFVLHWSFLLELGLLGVALASWSERRANAGAA